MGKMWGHKEICNKFQRKKSYSVHSLTQQNYIRKKIKHSAQRNSRMASNFPNFWYPQPYIILSLKLWIGAMACL